MVAASHEAGLRVVEVTLDSDAALEQIRAISESVSEITVGVGSVTRPEQIGPAVDAGARFVVSPVTLDAVITACHAIGIPSIPGAATPTEIQIALEKGATAVKVFPVAQLGGPAFLRAMRAPLLDPPLVPTGGIDLDSVSDYLDAGAVALGVGSSLLSDELARSAPSQVCEHVARWIEAVTR